MRTFLRHFRPYLLVTAWFGGAGLLAVTLILAGFVILNPIPAYQLWCEYLMRGELDRNRSRYEGIVEAILARGLQRDEELLFRVSPDYDPATLTLTRNPTYESLREETFVKASLKMNRRTTVLFRPYSLGHAGAYGLYYSSGPPNEDELKYLLGNDGRPTQVDANWWAVSDYSQ